MKNTIITFSSHMVARSSTSLYCSKELCLFYVRARKQDSIHNLLPLHPNNAMPNAISQSLMNRYLNLYAVLSYSSSLQRGCSFHGSRSLEGSLIRKPDFDRIHPFHVLGPTYRRYILANNTVSNTCKRTDSNMQTSAPSISQQMAQ